MKRFLELSLADSNSIEKSIAKLALVLSYPTPATPTWGDHDLNHVYYYSKGIAEIKEKSVGNLLLLLV